MAAGVLRAHAGLSARLAAFDREVDRFFDEHLRSRPAADRLFYAASALGDHGLIWLILATLRGLRSGEHFPAAVRTAVGVAVESAVINGPVKLLFRRSRPVHEGLRPLPLRTPRTSSFPSGHATSAFCAASLLSEDDPLWPLYYAIATAVAWSRVHVKIHHASDVAAGIAIGAVMGHLGRRLSPLHGKSARSPGRVPGR
jgi:membrane-associated phospholipid phosphatase